MLFNEIKKIKQKKSNLIIYILVNYSFKIIYQQ